MIETLAEHIGDSRLLLVIDNCEHLVDSVAGLVESLLRRCDGLQVLATSRQRLRVPGEVVWRIAPLSVPPPDAGSRAGFDRITDSEAVRLFEARARSEERRVGKECRSRW